MNKQLKAFLLAPLFSIPCAIYFGVFAAIDNKYSDSFDYETFIVLLIGIPLLAYFLVMIFFPVHLLYKKLKVQSVFAYVLPSLILSMAHFLFNMNEVVVDIVFVFSVAVVVFSCGLVPYVFWNISIERKDILTGINDRIDIDGKKQPKEAENNNSQ